MNKVKFLKILNKKLARLPEDERKGRLEFYEEIINDKIDEGLSEQEAIAEIGNTDDIVKDILEESKHEPYIKLKGKYSTTQIVLIILGFPLWFSLILAGFAVALSLYIVMWALVLVAFALLLSFAIGSLVSFIIFIVKIFFGEFSLMYLGAFLACAGLAILTFYGSVALFKLAMKLTSRVISINKGK